jgi:ComF family protein
MACRALRAKGSAGEAKDLPVGFDISYRRTHLLGTSALETTFAREIAGWSIRSARRMVRSAVDLVYPPTCIACEAATGSPHGLCAVCWAGLRFIERPYCERLGVPFPVDLGGPLLSPAAMADPPVFGRARAAVRFDETARVLVHRLKYGDRLDLAQALGSMMARAGTDVIGEAEMIVPVPLHAWRLWGRRFNQAMALGAVIGRRSGLPCDPFVLARVRRTRPQVGLTRAQRQTNLQGAFRVPLEAAPRLAGRRILLVDDVLTTGSTANAASRALLRGGAATVDVLAFARVVTDA